MYGPMMDRGRGSSISSQEVARGCSKAPVRGRHISGAAGLGLGAGVSASATSNEGRESAHVHGGV